jgi:flagellar M-ring protein FliF
MQFAQVDMTEGAGAAADQIAGLPKADVMRLAEMLIMGILAILVILLVVRPLMKRMLESTGTGGGAGGTDAIGNAGAGQRAIGATAGQGALAPPSSAMSDIDDATQDSLIDIGRIDGRVRASAVKKVGEIIDKHPDESVSILRNWIYQQGRS